MKHTAMQAWGSYRRVGERRRLRSFATDCLPERRAYPATNIQHAIDPNKKSAVLKNSLLAIRESVGGASYARDIAGKYPASHSLKTTGTGKIVVEMTKQLSRSPWRR